MGRLKITEFIVEDFGKTAPMGRCWAVDCEEAATKETLLGLHFCAEHFGRFYSNQTFAMNPEREFDD